MISGISGIASCQVGFFSDDAHRALGPGFRSESGQDRYEYLTQITRELCVGGTRFLPLHFVVYSTTWTSHPFAHRAIRLLLFLLSNLALAVFIRLWLGSARPALLSLASLGFLVQIRDYHDPLLGFGGLLLAVCLINLIALIVLTLGIEHRNAWTHVCLSSLLFLLALWTYEASLAFLVAHFLIARRRGIQFALPALAVTLLSLALHAVMRVTQSGGYPGTSLSLGAEAVLRTLLLQLFGTLPLSFSWKLAVSSSVSEFGGALALFALLFFVLSKSLAEVVQRPLPRAGEVIAIGLSLALLPAIPVAISAKYQFELHPGLAYIPVHVSILGLAILFGVWLDRLILSGRGRAVAVAVCSVLAAATFVSNVHIGRRAAAAFTAPRELTERALATPLAKVLTSNESIVISTESNLEEFRGGWGWYRWELPAFFRMHAGISPGWTLSQGWVRARDGSEFEATSEWKNEQTQKSLRVILVRKPDPLHGIVLTAPLAHFRADSAVAEGEALAYVEGGRRFSLRSSGVPIATLSCEAGKRACVVSAFIRGIELLELEVLLLD